MYDIQKSGMGKRISAFLFDIIIFAILAVGVAFLFSAILGYNSKLEEMEAHYDKYSEEYGIVLDISESEFEELSEEEKARFNEANEAIIKDDEVQALYSAIINLSLVILTLSILVATLILEFAVPLFFGNGQTLGKKIFAVAVVRSDSVKVTPVILFIRSVLGKFTIETMAPVMILFMIFFANAGFYGTLSLVLLIGFNVASMIFTKNNCMIHDLLANTVAVEMSTQMIFETADEMLAYKKRIHEAAVERAKTTY